MVGNCCRGTDTAVAGATREVAGELERGMVCEERAPRVLLFPAAPGSSGQRCSLSASSPGALRGALAVLPPVPAVLGVPYQDFISQPLPLPPVLPGLE